LIDKAERLTVLFSDGQTMLRCRTWSSLVLATDSCWWRRRLMCCCVSSTVIGRYLWRTMEAVCLADGQGLRKTTMNRWHWTPVIMRWQSTLPSVQYVSSYFWAHILETS